MHACKLTSADTSPAAAARREHTRSPSINAHSRRSAPIGWRLDANPDGGRDKPDGVERAW
jgi:hypothetical protein